MNFSHSHYATYTSIDFILDDNFVSWIQHPNAEKIAFWAEFIQEYPAQEKKISEAKFIILHLKVNVENLQPDVVEQIWQNLQITHQSEFAPQSPKIQPIYMLTRYWKSIAASVAFLYLLGGIAYWKLNQNHKTQQILYSTNFGETRKILLPDSSEVILNANSSLTLDDKWTSEKQREVWLNGEAFFKVTKQKMPTQANAQFVVHTSNVNVEVLGTEFNVNNRHKKSTVILNTGKVKLTNNEDGQIVMHPGDLVSYADSERVFRSKIVNPNNFSAWIYNRLLFENTSLKEIAALLNDNYGLKVIVKQPFLLEKKITGTIPAKNIKTLLLALEESLNINIKQQDSTLIFSKR